MDSDVLIQAEHVSKRFCKSLRRSLWYGVQDIAGELVPFSRTGRPGLRHGEFWALDDVSFELRRGEALGVIGPNGAGKSTLLRLLNGLLKPDAGQITVQGRTGALIELGTGFNPILTGRENVYINAAMLGLSRRQVDGIFDQIVDFAEIGDFIDAPVQNYSSGMWVRLAFAVAAHLNPNVLLVDEVLAVGDMAFQRKCIQHMMRYLSGGGAIVLVTHNIYLMQSVCSRSLLLDRGRMAFAGTAVEGVSRYFESQTQLEQEYADAAPEMEDTLPVKIEDTELIPVAGGHALRSGQDIALRLRYRSREDIGRVFWAFAFYTVDQSICITGGVSSEAAHKYEVHEGSGEFSCTIPSLPLTPGTYVMRAFIVDQESGAPIARLGWETPAKLFTVIASYDERENLRSMGGAFMTMNVEWNQPEVGGLPRSKRGANCDQL